jgi:bifunctional UDP-N-acetylglucosamine pyrophosphorylase/glucosamine-1-phosphate N-acetyltransferase
MTSVIILAAGAGTRMKSDLPKVLHKIAGKPMIYFIIKEAKKISDDVHIVLYHQKDKISSYINEVFDNVHIHIQNHTQYPGTAGAVMNIEFKYPKTFVLNGDMPLINSTKLQDFLNKDSDIVLSSIKMNNPDGYGRIVIDTNDKVIKIVEQKDADEEIKEIKEVNAGVYLFDTNLLYEFLSKINSNNSQNEYYLTDIIELCINANKNVSRVVVDSKVFMGVNNKYELSIADSIKQENIKKKFMLDGVIFENKDSVYCEDGVVIEGECIIESGVIIRGDSVIKNSHIKGHSIIEDGIILDSSIGPFARIRPNSNIKDTHIGNFVEVKKSNLNNIKAGHLSYIGDCQIDEGTNIGAGFVSCNYDGVNKHKTIIGKNVFVGSGVKVVAPSTIEDDVIIGAGTTIRENLKQGVLAVSKPVVKIIPEYFYKFFKKK